MVPVARHVVWNDENMHKLAAMKNKHLVIADTIEELAEKTQIPEAALKQTIERYNTLCHKKCDDDFGKDPDYLIPVAQGPYYAIRTFLMSDGVEGGIPINENCQVMGKNGLVEGLYAAGDNSSGNIVRRGNSKYMITNEYGWALCSGMISGDAMISQLS